MARRSAGILAYRTRGGVLEVFLAHPGGPFWDKKDAGVWSIPKGLVDPGEDLLAAAKREFEEETGFTLQGEFLPLGAAQQAGGKVVHVWAAPAELDAARITSNTFELEWPPGSGAKREFPEVDRAGWFPIPAAGAKIVEGQEVFLERLTEALAI